MPGSRFRLSFACAAAVLCPDLSHAQATPAYRIDEWGTDKGLPSAFVSDMVRSRDGFLWLAAGGLLTRFDGHEFRTYSAGTDPAITARVSYLHAGVGDTTWIGLEDGWVLSMAHGRIARVARTPTTPFGRFTQDDRGALVVFANIVYRREQSDFRPLTMPKGHEFVRVLHRDAGGVVWAISTNRALLRLTHRGAEVVATGVGALVPDRTQGQVYFSRRSDDVGELMDSAGRVVQRFRQRGEVSPVLVDRGGRLWATAPGALLVFAPERLDPTHRIAFNSNDASNVIEDDEGNIWMAGNGLARVQEAAFRTVTRAPGLLGNANQVDEIWPGPNGSVLARVIPQPGLYRFDGLESARLHRAGRPNAVLASGVDQRGTVWTSYQYGPSGGITGERVSGPAIVMNRHGYLLHADDPVRPGSIWFWSHDSLRLFRAEPYGANGPRVVDSLPLSGFLRTMSIGPDGAVWLAQESDHGQVLTRYQHGEKREWSAADGLPPAQIRTILPDRDGSTWLGTYGAGLVRMRENRFTAVRASNGLAEDVVSGIIDDGAGNFWLSGNRSIHRVRIDDARAVLNGSATRVTGVAYTRRDGLSDPETTGRAGARSANGWLWFPTFGGAAVVDPARALALDSTPPKVHVLGVRAANDSVSHGEGARLRRGDRRVTIAYTGISLRNPDGVRYEHRIDGVDASWVDAGASRVATYTDIGPGAHTFRVRARSAGGVWSANDATLTFTVPPYFHETLPFAALVAALLALAAWAGIRLRERQSRLRELELGAQVATRTAELGRALVTVEAQASQLRTLDEAKSRFFANVSHEFRTPLSLIQGPVEDVRDGRAGAVSEMARRRLDTVMSNVKRLVQLVEQLLDVARLESGTLQLRAEVRDLVPVLRRITESFSSLAERRGLSFQVSCPVGGVRVRFDPDQMEKIVGNLLGNALKFTPAGGRVELRARIEAEAWAVIEVEDNGPGIPEEHQARVFDRFYQVDDSARRAHEGAGIGLALARELVDLHGGQLTVRSVVAAGSTFIVRLPLATPGAALHVSGESSASPAPAAETGSVRGPEAAAAPVEHDRGDVTTVLVVEDNAELRAWLRDRLADEYRVIEAPNGAVALTLAREHVPDLIISDVMMPELDGHSLVQAVKTDPEIDFVPIILLTAKASRESRLAGLEGGADDYLHKPVDVRELLVRANNLIVSRRRLRERYVAAERTLPTLSVPLKPGHRDAATEAFVKKLYDIVAERVADESLTVDTLASAAGMGRSTLYRKVEEVLGRSPMDAVWEYRLEQAAQWLAETDANVSEIAYGVGFKSVPHFCSRFRVRFQATPSAYRRQRAPNPSM